MIWATRGRYWGFRFLQTNGFVDPLVEYERAFAGTPSGEIAFKDSDGTVALRFYDPLKRKDRSGRVIPHEFVLTGAEARMVETVEDGIKTVWPLVSEYYDQIWAKSSAPKTTGS